MNKFKKCYCIRHEYQVVCQLSDFQGMWMKHMQAELAFVIGQVARLFGAGAAPRQHR